MKVFSSDVASPLANFWEKLRGEEFQVADVVPVDMVTSSYVEIG